MLKNPNLFLPDVNSNHKEARLMKKVILQFLCLIVAAGSLCGLVVLSVDANKEIYPIGDTVATDYMECTIHSVEKKDGTIIVSYSLKNIGDRVFRNPWGWIVTHNQRVTNHLSDLIVLDYGFGRVYECKSGSKVLWHLKPGENALQLTNVYHVHSYLWNEPCVLRISLYSKSLNENVPYDKMFSDYSGELASHTFEFTIKIP